MLLVFGSRPPKDDPPAAQRYALGVRDVLDRVLDATPPTVLLEGGAQGPDLWARHLVSRSDRVSAGWSNRSENVPDEVWRSQGRAAGPLRNARMAKILAGQKGTWNRLAVGFWDGCSRGTRSMISELHRASIPALVFHVDERFQVSWPAEWRSVRFTDQHGTHRLGIAGADAQSARVVLSPYPDLLTMRWSVLYRARDAGGWTDVQIDSWEGWPTVPLRTSAGHGTATGAT